MTGINLSLETAINNNNEEDIIKNLKVILSETQNVKYENISTLKVLLQTSSNEIIKLTLQVIAESGKHETNRKKLTDNELIVILLSLLDNKNISCLIQVCRALGNICYENDEARTIINNYNGIEKIINVIELSINLSGDDTTNSQLMKVACGLLFNYLISNEPVRKTAISLDVFSLIENIFKKKINSFSSNEDLFTHLLLILTILSEQPDDNWFSNDLCIYLVEILEKSMNPEISEFCLELLHKQAEIDSIKASLAQKGLCELLFNLLEQHKSLAEDEDSRALMKLACDLIVLILTGDESMTYLYTDGEGNVYRNMLSWLRSDDVDLLITGVLAIGNFARNDKHCIKMVEDGLSEILLELLSKHNQVNDDIRLQHALLSALRNLVIPAQNKYRILSNGLVDVIYPMLAIEQYPVIFKLLGTLRMVIDGQEKAALDIILRVDFLEKLVDWCFNADHPGVRAESPRLLAWLIKHCHSSKSYSNIIKVKDSVRCLVEMIPSSYAVMQNEALVALSLLCVYDQLESTQRINIMNQINDLNLNDERVSFEHVVCNTDIGKFIAFLVNKYSDKMEKEVIENLLTLLEKLIPFETLKENFKKNNVQTALRKYLNRSDLASIVDRINKISNDIDSG